MFARTKTVLYVMGLGILLCGCAARTGTNTYNAQAQASPHAEPVCLLRAPLPSGIKHKVLGQVESSKQWYGGIEEILVNMGNEARRIGADAVVSMTAGQKMGFFAWARPVGVGMGVKLENRSDLNCVALGGEFR